MKRLTLAFVVWCVVAGQAQPVTYTHYVTPDGSATGGCTQAAPCSFARAVSSLPAGSVVQMAAGIYSQAAVTIARNGLRFVGEGEVRIVGTRTKPDPASWTLAAGQTYTYETPTTYLVASVAQRPPVSTWTPILVDDRVPPYTVSQGRPFDLDFPIRYTQKTSLGQVEAQSCTFIASSTKVSVHMCHDGVPVDADNLYVGSSGWGQINIDGDDTVIENVTLEQVPGTALHVNLAADRTILRHVIAKASQVWLEGRGTVAEDGEIGYVIAQGPYPNVDCYDANPTFGKGECWQGGGGGDALLVGKQGSTLYLNQTVRRYKVHRSWNGARIDGFNTLEDSTLWGFPNHTLQASGQATIRRNALMQGQDSLYIEGSTFNNLLLEHNAFINGVLVWNSRDGRPIYPSPTTWTFRYNLLPAIVLDDRTYPVAKMDCNVYIPNNANPSHLMKITSTVGGPGVTYKTLAQVKANTPLEANSIERPYTDWKTGALFKNFTDPKVWQAFDFSDPLSVCGQRVGPQAAAP